MLTPLAASSGEKALQIYVATTREREISSGNVFTANRANSLDRIYPQRRVGKFLDEVLPQTFKEQALLFHQKVVGRRQPSFSFSMLRPLVRHERLLLPFVCDGGEEVERIVGAITLFTEDNGCDAKEILAGRLVDR